MGGLHQRLKLAEDEGRRMIQMLPEDSLRRHIASHAPDAGDAMVDQMVAYSRRQAEAAEQVTKSTTLTPEEKEIRYREIFGLK